MKRTPKDQGLDGPQPGAPGLPVSVPRENTTGAFAAGRRGAVSFTSLVARAEGLLGDLDDLQDQIVRGQRVRISEIERLTMRALHLGCDVQRACGGTNARADAHASAVRAMVAAALTTVDRILSDLR